MDDSTIVLKSGDDLTWLKEQIEREKRERLQQIPPNNRALTAEQAISWLSRPALQKAHLIALLQGMTPVDGEMGWLDPADNWVVQRVIKDEIAGVLRFPLARAEGISLLRSYYYELELPLQVGLDSVEQDCPSPTRGGAKVVGATAKSKIRKNSAVAALAELDLYLKEAVEKLKDAGMEFHCNAMPGTKSPFIQYAQQQSKRLQTITPESIDKRYLQKTVYRWPQTGGSRDQMNHRIRCALGLPT